MWRMVLSVLCVLVVLLPLCVVAKPMGGKFSGENAISLVLDNTGEGDAGKSDCRHLTLYNKGHVYLSMKGKADRKKDNNKEVTVKITVTILKSQCANFANSNNVDELMSQGYITNVTAFTFTERLKSSLHSFDLLSRKGSSSPSTSESAPRDNRTQRKGSSSPSTSESAPKDNGTSLTEAQQEQEQKDKGFMTDSSGIYIVCVESKLAEDDKDVKVDMTFKLEMVNFYGYLSAIDYPAFVFYGAMTAVYGIMGMVWAVAMCCSYKDLVRLQFWVFAVIILGFLEKMFFVSEYSSVNLGEQSTFLNPLAEAISAAKRALARVLLIIVSLGFGTVKPRLGDSLGKVVAIGIIYFIFALIDGIVRARTYTYDTQNTSEVVTLALLLIIDFIIFYWAFTSLVAVRRALRLRKNYVKLSMYNHFGYTLIFAILAALAFLLWMLVEVTFPRNQCLEDWQEVWLRDCFWHFLFCFILVVIMIIWRPSYNSSRFAYSLVNDLEQEAEEEEMENKNFETVKMRSVSRMDGTPPPVSSQAEDDLRWVEENLPTTAMDKALPLLLDSDEEVMNTKFEASKMN